MKLLVLINYCYAMLAPITFTNTRSRTLLTGKGQLEPVKKFGKNPSSCGDTVKSPCFHMVGDKCVSKAECYELQCYQDFISFKFKKELLFQQPDKDLHYKSRFEDNFFVKLQDELVRGNCQNGTFYETPEDDDFDVHFIVGFDNQCSQRIDTDQKIIQRIPIGSFIFL